MYILTNDKDVIVAISEVCEQTASGWKISDHTAYRSTTVKRFEVDDIPAGIVPQKYRYRDLEFSLNPEWIDPNAETINLTAEVERLKDTMSTVKTDVYGTDPKLLPMEEYRTYLRNQNNLALASFLKNNPLPWSNGKHYGVTGEDQSLMLNNYSGWKMFTSLGIDVKLEWNASDEGCSAFSEGEYIQLMGAIYIYAKKMLKLCQWYKVKIINAVTRDEINEIELIYSVEKADEVIALLYAATKEE